MKNFRINSIYLATEGEGLLIGRVQVFVRFQGCLLGCQNCDSKDTWSFNRGSLLTLTEVLAEIKALSGEIPIKTVSITGVDPLHLNNKGPVLELVVRLKELGYTISIEVAGDLIDSEIFTRVDFINFDFKTPSSGVQTSFENLLLMQKNFSGKFQVKSVVENYQDFEYLLNYYKKMVEQVDKISFSWVITPAYNLLEKFPQGRFIDILSWNESNGGFFRVIGQQHKWVYGPDKKLV